MPQSELRIERIAAMSPEEYAAWDAEQTAEAIRESEQPEAELIPHEEVMKRLRQQVAAYQLAERKAS